MTYVISTIDCHQVPILPNNGIDKKIIDTEVNYTKIPCYDTKLEIKNCINSKFIKYIGY